MKDPRREYEAALADFSQPGNRWQAKGRLTYWGKAAGLTADEIISDARAAGVRDRDADIRRGWNDVKPKGEHPTGWRRNAQRAKPPTFPRYVRDCIGDLADRDKSGWPRIRDLFLDLKSLSPWEELTAWDSETDISALCLREYLTALFDPDDVLHVFRDDAPTAGKPGLNLMPCRDWLARLERGEAMQGDLIVPNPFTGAEGETTDGKKSYIAQSCIARFPFLVVEFDSMPLELQCAFWRGFLAKSPLAPKVAAVTYSGGKSLHGLLHVGCRTLTDWQNACDGLKRLLCADPDPCFRADEQAMRPRTGTRLPGVCRFSNGKTQRLLYLNPEAVRPTAAKPHVSPTRAPEGREAAYNRTDAQTDKRTPEVTERATGAEIGVFAHVSSDRLLVRDSDMFMPPPQEPDGNAPIEEVLAYFEVLESMA